MVARLAQQASVNLGAEQVAVISYSDQRAGAWNQTQLLSAQSGVDCFRATNATTLKLLLEEHGQRKFIIIDTPGVQMIERVAEIAKGDANDQLYAIEAVMDYDPAPLLDKITAKLLAINFADDEVNPTELGVVEPAIKKIPGARFVLVPASAETQGHFTHLQAAIWKPHLAAFLKELG